MTLPPFTPAFSRAGAILQTDPEMETIGPEAFAAVARVLRSHSGFSLESYKDKCVKRRITIRIRATRSPCAESYALLLERDPAEREHLLRVLTIHVSHFFRNPSTFEKLSRDVLPALLERIGDGAPLRIWSVGCATGEEPYSLALILKERFAMHLSRLQLSLVGSDVDPETLSAARSGRYAPERVSEVDGELLKRWFTPCGTKYELSREIRDLVTFRQGDLNDPSSFLSSDLILCRNVLIYFERARQEEILMRYAERLPRNGVLVLGKSETLVGEARRRFLPICPVERIYRAV